MRIDLDYYASIFRVFTEAETADITLPDLEEAGIEVGDEERMNEKFIFHILLALDNGLVALRNGPAYTLEDLGIIEGSMGGTPGIFIVRIRLTQQGHDFAAVLNNSEVLSKLKSEFKDAPFKVLFEGGQKLIQHFMKKKLDELIT